MTQSKFIPLSHRAYPVEEMERRAAEFCSMMQRRRSVRAFSERQVSHRVIEHCLRAAGTAPSGANMQPWHFVAVANPDVKRQIRLAAEETEQAFYQEQASEEWLEALKPLGTGISKPFLEVAPYLIVVFAQRYGRSLGGERIKHYYVTESVGIAVGLLITAIHQAGLVTLPYTPSPMGFLREILHRPDNERPFLVLPVGYPADDATVPALHRKPLDEIATLV